MSGWSLATSLLWDHPATTFKVWAHLGPCTDPPGPFTLYATVQGPRLDPVPLQPRRCWRVTALPPGLPETPPSDALTYPPPVPVVTAVRVLPQYSRGSTLSASWSGITTPTPRDWLGLYPEGEANNQRYLAWVYVSCTQRSADARREGVCPFPLPAALTPGVYEIRFLRNDGYVAVPQPSLRAFRVE
jgi:hypothetical protein